MTIVMLVTQVEEMECMAQVEVTDHNASLVSFFNELLVLDVAVAILVHANDHLL